MGFSFNYTVGKKEKKMKKTTKKILGAALALGMMGSMVGCSSSTSSSADNADKKTYKVGICNYVDDASLNQIVDNIKKQLTVLGDDNNVEFVVSYDNCNADANVLSQIVANFIADKVDLMVGVATPVAINMQSATEENQIPVVFAAVSDPLGCGLVDSLDKPGKNITGTSDYLNTDAIMNLILANDPDAQKVGLLYDVGQDSSTAAIADAKKFLEGKGIEVVEKNGTNASEVLLAAQALVTEGVDAVFTPSDNTIMAAELSIYETLAEAGIPHYAGADSFALNGAFLGYGVDYANLGVETANMINEILVKGSKPADTAVKTFDNGTATINTDICTQLGLDFDKLSEVFAPYCTKIEKIVTAESFDE